MSRTIPPEIQDEYDEGVAAIAVLILIEKVDGGILGFTDWDEFIVFESNYYIPAISMSPSAIKTNSDFTSDQLDIIGSIDSAMITEDDLEGGRFDFAKITMYRVNPYHPEWGGIKDLAGTLGGISYGDGEFKAEILSKGHQLSQMVGDVISPVCNVKQLGDAQCKVDIEDYQFERAVNIVVNQATLNFVDTHATGYYQYGLVRFLPEGDGGGANHDLVMEIKTSILTGMDNQGIVLQEAMPFPINPGDMVILEAGCDRRSITCRDKFSNLTNFHGFPYVPGNDWLGRTGRPPA